MSALRGTRVVLRGGQRRACASTRRCGPIYPIPPVASERMVLTPWPPLRVAERGNSRRAYERPIAQAARNGRAGPRIPAGPQDGRSRGGPRAGEARGVDAARGAARIAATRGPGGGALDEQAPQGIAA